MPTEEQIEAAISAATREATVAYEQRQGVLPQEVQS